MTSQLGEVLTAMREDRAALTQTLQSLMTPRDVAPSPAVAPSTVMPAIRDITIAALPTLGTILAAIISRPAKPPTDLMGLVEIAQLLAGKEPRESDDDTSMAGIIKAVAGPGLQLLNTLAQNSARTVNPMPASRPAPAQQLAAPSATVAAVQPLGATQATAATPLPAPSAEPSNEEKSMLALLKPQLEELCNLAEANQDPVETAKLTAQLLPAQFDEVLSDLLETPQSFARLQLLVPRMKAHATWFEALRAALLEEMFGPEEAATP
jgi:hypothetical protein